jgi:hypothetical protein
MAQYAHKGQILPLTNQMIPMDKDTTFHASYDKHFNGASKEGVTFPIGYTTVSSFPNDTNVYVSTGKWTDVGMVPNANNFTVEIWYRKKSTGSRVRLLGGSGFTITDNGNGQFKLTKYGVVDVYLGTVPADTNWHHVAVSYSSTTGTSLYLDGQLVATHANTAALSSGYSNLPSIGWAEYGGFDGEACDFRLWNRVLRRNEINDNMYKVLTGDEDGLVKYLKLNEKEGSIAFDSSSMHIDAIRVGNITTTTGPTIASLVDGKFGKAALIEPDTVNLMAGRSMTVDTSYGVVGGTDGTGTYFIPQNRTQSWAGIRIPGTSVAAGQKYTVSFEILCDKTFNLAWDPNVTGGGYTGNDAGRNGQTYSTVYDTPGQWKKVWLTCDIKSDLTSPVASDSFCPGDSRIMDGTKIYYRNPQIEQRDYPTSYTSTSRPLGKLYYPKELINLKAFTISCWFNLPHLHQSGVLGGGIIGDYWAPIIELCPTSNRGRDGFAVTGGYGTSKQLNLKSAGSWHGDKRGITNVNENEWHHLVVTFDGAAYKVYLDGSLEINYADTTLSNVFPDTVLMVGGGYYGKPLCMIDELRIEARAISTDEVSAWAASGLHYNYFDYSMYVD